MKNSLLLILAGGAFLLFLVLGKKKEEPGPPDGTGPAPSPDGTSYAPDSLVEEYIARMRAATTNAGLSAVYEEAGEHYGGYLAPYFTEAQFARIDTVYRALPWPEEAKPTTVTPTPPPAKVAAVVPITLTPAQVAAYQAYDTGYPTGYGASGQGLAVSTWTSPETTPPAAWFEERGLPAPEGAQPAGESW